MEKSSQRWLTEMEAAQRAGAALRNAVAARAAPRIRFIVGSDASRSSSPAPPSFAGHGGSNDDEKGEGEAAETDADEGGEDEAAAAAAGKGARRSAALVENEVVATAQWALQSAARARKRLEGGDAPSSAPAPKRPRYSVAQKMSIRAAALPPVPHSLMDRAIFVLWGTHRLTLKLTLGEEDG